MKKVITVFCLTVFTMLNTVAQTSIEGRIYDNRDQRKLGDINVSFDNNKAGTITDLNGFFRISTGPGQYTLKLSGVGYYTKTIEVKVQENEKKDLGAIYLEASVIALDEVNIISSVADDRKTPVALSSVHSAKIITQLGDRPFPEVMKMVPGVYAAREGGGSGDASVNIRGFNQENVGLLLNGIPVSSVENGLVYWNNWIGLSDVTRSIQVQRGLGASNVALNSVGGTINIITKTTDSEKGGSAVYSVTSYGNSKFTLSLSTGLMKNGLAVNFLGSRTKGIGYVDGTYVDAWGYFISLSKEFNSRHKLVFTALGAPERHGQRTLKLSKNEIDLHGIRFNKDWGSYNGNMNNASENFYHKPYLTLNHYWSASERVFLASSIYYTPGYGGGKWSEVYGYGTPTIFQYRNPSGQIDWDAIYLNNATHNDTAVLATGQRVTGYSKNIQTNFLASHFWAGILSRLEYRQSDHIRYSAGIHLRAFRSKLQEKVRDLLGGQFFIDDYAWAVDGLAGRNEIKTVGDVIKVNNGAYNPSGNIFGQVEYSSGKTTGFISGTFNNMWYQRWDEYNYVSDTKSEVILKTGFDLKAGINYNLSETHNLYFNGGYFSRVPYYKYVFGNYTNVPTRDISNEKVTAMEAGYGFNGEYTRVKANGYLAYWQDKNFLSDEYIQLENNTRTRALITGLDALHTGVEMEIEQKINGNAVVGGMLSIGNWKWKNDVSATLFNDNNIAVDTVNVYADGLYVGDAPQVQAGAFFEWRILRLFNFSGNWYFYDRLYANFDPSGRNDPNDDMQPYRLPDYSLLDLYFEYPFTAFQQRVTLNLACYNVFDSKYIIRGEDGVTHDEDSFTGFWGFGRNFSFSLRMDF